MANDNFIKKFLQPSAKGQLWRNFILIIIIAIAGLLIDTGSYFNKATDWLDSKTKNTVRLPHVKEVPFQLGLDLQGGTQLIYQADVSKIDDRDKMSAVEGVRDVIERRVNVFGVSEPVVQANKSGSNYQVIVELAGVKNIGDAIKMIGETPLLEFKEESDKPQDLNADQKNKIDTYNKNADEKASSVLGKLLSGGDFSELAKEFSDDSNTKDKGGDIGWITNDTNPDIVSIAQKLKNGQTSETVKTTNGIEIVKLEEKRIKKNPFNNEDEKEIRASHLLICYKGAQGCTSEISKEDVQKKLMN